MTYKNFIVNKKYLFDPYDKEEVEYIVTRRSALSIWIMPTKCLENIELRQSKRRKIYIGMAGYLKYEYIRPNGIVGYVLSSLHPQEKKCQPTPSRTVRHIDINRLSAYREEP